MAHLVERKCQDCGKVAFKDKRVIIRADDLKNLLCLDCRRERSLRDARIQEKAKADPKNIAPNDADGANHTILDVLDALYGPEVRS